MAVAVAFIRAIGQLRNTAAQVERTMGRLEQTIPELERVAVEAGGVLGSLGDVVDRVDRLSEDFATTGSRLARASSLIVDEVVDPATKIAALARGVRAGATTLLGTFLERRAAQKRAKAHEGENHHE